MVRKILTPVALCTRAYRACHSEVRASRRRYSSISVR